MDKVSQESQFTSKHKGFTKVPYKIHRCYGLTQYEKLILIDLIAYMGDKSQCYSTIEMIARNVGCSSKSVERHIKELADKKLILHRKLADGKTKKQALICVMRRLVNIIYSMMKNKTEYRAANLIERQAS